MKLKVKSLVGKQWELEVPSSTSLEEVKKKLSETSQGKVPLTGQKFVYAGKPISNGTLSDWGILDGDFIVVYIANPPPPAPEIPKQSAESGIISKQRQASPPKKIQIHTNILKPLEIIHNANNPHLNHEDDENEEEEEPDEENEEDQEEDEEDEEDAGPQGKLKDPANSAPSSSIPPGAIRNQLQDLLNTLMGFNSNSLPRAGNANPSLPGSAMASLNVANNSEKNPSNNANNASALSLSSSSSGSSSSAASSPIASQMPVFGAGLLSLLSNAGNPAAGNNAAIPPIPAAAPAQPQVDAVALQTLRDMGFTEASSKKALLLNRMNTQLAMEWLLNNEGEEDLDEPLSDSALQQIQQEENDFQSDPLVEQRLREMGFTSEDIQVALRSTNNNYELAAAWLLGDRDVGAGGGGGGAGGAGGSSSDLNLSNLDESNPDSQVIQAILTHPSIQAGLSNQRIRQAFQSMIENPANAQNFVNDPEIGPMLLQIHNILNLVQNPE